MNEHTILERKIDNLESQIGLILAHQKKQQDLIDDLITEVAPISRQMMGVLVERLDDLEKRGYMEFGQSLVNVMDKVVTSYTSEDLEDLGNSVVAILDTVKSLTQPEMLRMAREASDAIKEADKEKPMGPYAVVKMASKDKDVRRGMAVMMSLLRHVGKGARSMSHNARLESTAPKRKRQEPRPVRPHPAERKTTTRDNSAVNAPIVINALPSFQIGGVSFAADGFIEDVSQWTPELALLIAQYLELEELSEEHWKVINFSRAAFASSGASPNVRKISKGSEVSIKQLYLLFPDKPGLMSAQIAGIPKPKGCI